MQGKKPGGSSGGGRSGELQGDEAQRNKKKKKKVSCFSNIKIFLVSECALMLAQGTVGAYLVSVLTTLERRFNLQSADVGVIASSFEIGNLALILFVSYFGARGHRPRLIGCGGIVMALGALLSALPEFLTHQYKYEAGEIRWGAEGRDVCAANGSGGDQGPDPDLICRSRTATNMMYLLLIGAQVLLGIGATPVQPLGVSYIDDHVRRKDSSLYIGILFTMLVFGPACGFILGSFCTKIYVDAVFIDTSNLDITPDDPRWIGAWWGGFLLCGALLFFSSLLMFGFPQSLPPHSDPAMESEQAMLPEREYERPKPSNGVLRHPLEPDSSASCFQQLKVIPKVTKHLLSNPVFTCIILAACMEIAVVAGFAAFLGKYLEQQFNLTTSSANQLLGMTAIPCACLGIFLGGLLVKKLSLSALGAIRMAMLVNLVSTACYVSFLFLGCDTGPVAGVTVPYGNTSAPGSALDPYSPCNKNCECQTDSFTPVCGADGITYLSACFAGCNSTNLTGCACLTTVPPENTTVVPGKCPSPGCQEAFLTFLCVMCVCSMIGAMAQTPSVIILIRTVSPELKSYALGVLFLLLRLLGWNTLDDYKCAARTDDLRAWTRARNTDLSFIPPPLIFGAGIDSTCLFWSTFCGEQGACVLYDNVAYRYLYVSIAIVLKSSAFVLYTTTWQCLRKNYKRYIKNHEGGLSTKPDRIQNKENMGSRVWRATCWAQSLLFEGTSWFFSGCRQLQATGTAKFRELMVARLEDGPFWIYIHIQIFLKVY
uniref:Solute carrier organic anion transporter family member n=2 Tax=Caniformia TaxID=379584 RepID=A0A8C0Z6M2_CANLF